jgi:hypothetical protein
MFLLVALIAPFVHLWHLLNPAIRVLNNHQQESDWRTDWLYALIFARAEDSWEEFCRTRNPDSEHWRYGLIAEWSAADDDPHCCGMPVRAWAWTRDDDGLNEISIRQYEQHMSEKKPEEPAYPFVQVAFHISPDRKHVVYSEHPGPKGGWGRRFIVDGEGESASLRPDPDAGGWIS